MAVSHQQRFLSWLALSILLLGSAARAQETGSLFSAGALLRANRQHGSSSLSAGSATASLSRAVTDQFQLDTVDDIVLTHEKRDLYSSQYRAFEQFYISDTHSSALYDEELASQVSQRIAVYEGTVTLADILARSPVGNVYRRIIDSLTEYREHVTLRLGREADGKLGFVDRHTGSRQLLEFKLNANPSRGVEPRLRVYDDFLLKYDSIAGAALIEYNLSF